MEKIKKIAKWTGIVLLGLFILAEIIRLPFRLNEEKTKEQVVRIHATKLQLDDVLGKNLPPDPGGEADKTIAGVDANKNGIRDDVELAIFKEYPNSAKTRAVLLQYALALQMEFTQPIVNKETVTAVIEDNDSKALNCIWSISSRTNMRKFMEETTKNENFVKKRQINTEKRIKYLDNFYKNLGSYSSSSEGCDINLTTLPN